MTTVEKLLVQIFDRKNSIIEQVKQQTELYSQHLASKLLIDGIAPPSWLWNPNTSSDSNELNKEELISKLLRPYPQPSARFSVAHYPVYDDLAVRGDNDKFSNGVFMGNLASNKSFNRQDHPTVPPLSSEERAGCALTYVPEPDASVTSPEDQTDERIVNIYNAPDQSLARIHRSKSRQKALQIRNSATAPGKSGVSNENIRDVFSSQIRFSLSANNQDAQNDELPKLAEPCVIGSQSCADWDSDKADNLSKEKENNVYSGRITSSRTYGKVPDFVRGSLTVGSSEECKDNAASHNSELRGTQSMPTSDSVQANNYVNNWQKSAGPSAVYCQSCGDTKVDGADYISSDMGTNVFAGRSTRSNMSSKCQSCGCDSSKADISSDDYKRIDTAMMGSKDDLPPECVYGSPLSPSDVLNVDQDARELISGDCQSHRASDTVPSCSSNQQNACVDDVSELEIHSHSAKADDGIPAPLSGKSAEEVKNSKEAHGLVKPSVGLFRRVTRSQTQSNDRELYEPVAYNANSSLEGTVSKSDFKQKSAANDEIQNTSSGQLGPSCYGTRDMLDERENASSFKVNKLVLCDHVDQYGSNRSSDATQRRVLESEIAPTASDSFVFVEPKQLNFDELKECNLHAFTPSSGKQRLDNTLENVSCSFLDPAVSLDKGVFVGVNHLSLAKQSLGMPDISSKEEAARRDFLESNIQENPDNQAEKSGPVILNTVLNNSESKTEAGLNHKISEVFCETDSIVYETVDTPDLQIHPKKLHVKDGLEALPKRHMEEGDWSGEGKHRSHLVSSVPESESANLRASHAYNSANKPRAQSCDSLIGNVDMLNQICGVLDKLKQSPAQKSQIFSSLHEVSPLRQNIFVPYGTVCSHGESSSPKRRFRHVSLESWPQLKRRKIEHQRTHSLTTSPSFSVINPHTTQGDPASTYLENTDINIATAVDTFHADEHTDIEISPEIISNLVEGVESTFSLQDGEVEICYKKKNEHKNSSSVINSELLGVALVSSLKKDSINSQGCSIEEINDKYSSSIQFDARELGDGQHSQHLCNLEKNTDNSSSVNLNLTNTMLEQMQSPKRESGLQAQHSVLSPKTEDLELIDVDQSMPVLEGFLVDAQADSGVLDFATDGIDFDKLILPSNTIERASILAEICRSASLDKPSSHFSSAFEFQGNENLYQSVPNGHLENLDFARSSPLNSDVGEQLHSGRNFVDDYKALEGMPYSDCPAYSGARYGWDIKNQHSSPVGKIWERLSSHTGSSEKRLSSNPELTCFPIEEDASISEENKTVDENVGDVQEEVDSSLAKHCDGRQPLKDLSNLGLNPPMSVSAHEEILTADSVDLRTKLSVSGTQDKVQLGSQNKCRKKSEASEKKTSSIGATYGRKNQTSQEGINGIKKAKESINDSISKSLLSIKTGLKRQDQKLSLKDSKRNNIISNVSSFIPLIQQKQAVTVCAGKRDVKVKALEAAEAAKRLEEKKENERKMRKEALKLERAKLEEKNLRQLELEKKKKEDERKKKDADNIAKKRQREEEERKEKEKKRMRLETRYRQKEQEEKMRAGKAEKENRGSKDEQLHSKKEVLQPKKQQNREIVKEDDIALKTMETKLTTSEVVINYEECGTAGQSCDFGKVMHAVDKSPKNEDLIVHNSQGKSYEISPYQCSDDEDEEDDELPSKKYVPSWASKSNVALLLPLQQEMNPDTIFPPESFCPMEEVLLPRKLQQQVAA